MEISALRHWAPLFHPGSSCTPPISMPGHRLFMGGGMEKSYRGGPVTIEVWQECSSLSGSIAGAGRDAWLYVLSYCLSQ